ncbi:MAG: pyruvate kinase [Planctomycetes bacterium]|nr:pyruvate kinase [Planctomycetota bacterium]
MPTELPPERLRAALRAIESLLAATAGGEELHRAEIEAVSTSLQPSARNLAHYLAVRSRDLRELQSELHAMSLSSLGRMESHVRTTIAGVRRALLALLGERPHGAAAEITGEDDGDRRLQRHAAQLLGTLPPERGTHIMVTLPSDAASDRELVAGLLQGGMDVARINLAHDDDTRWTAMVRTVRGLAEELGRDCRILVDLPGPKLRTCGLPPGPRVVRVRPQRDLVGRCTAPAVVAFADPGEGVAAATFAGGPCVPLAASMLYLAAVGDELRVEDTGGRRRSFTITAVHGPWCVATGERTAYLGAGCRVTLRRDGEKLATGELGYVPAREAFVPLRTGDELVVAREGAAMGELRVLETGAVAPKIVGCTLPQVFEDVRPGQRILFDDGKIAGVVRANEGDHLRVQVTMTPPGGARLRNEKGINLPDTELQTPALTAHDRGLLDWVAQHADIVGMSFVQRTADVLKLEDEMHGRGRADIGVVLKIETAIGFARLPELLFAGLRNPPLGVMVARGDLAVEVGYERLAEVQEEILWLCEAAHVPVIWATQVLDAMARTGVPSRAEVTDAAMSGRAECVMLNKGPFIVDTVRFLTGVLARMRQHAAKKRWLLRRLSIAGKPPGEGA